MRAKWVIKFGSSRKVFYTMYHAEQFARALDLNGTEYVLESNTGKFANGKARYCIVSFDNSDGNFTGNPSPMAGNLTQGEARKMLATYRAIKHDGQQFRYIMQKEAR